MLNSDIDYVLLLCLVGNCFFQKGRSCEIPMSHFTLEATVDEITKMDAPLERGPLLRWQRKAIEAGMRAVSIDGYCVIFFIL